MSALCRASFTVAEDGLRRTIHVPESLRLYRGGGRDKLEQEGRCRLCLREWRVRPPSRHHLVPKSWFALYGLPSLLRDADANVVPLCRPCHDWVESPYDDAGRRMLRKLLGAAEAALAILLRGEEWFEDRYPRSAGAGRPVDQAGVAEAAVADPAGGAAARVGAVA